MRKSLVSLVLTFVVIGGVAALWVIPSYARTPQLPGTLQRPGMTEARVWVNNSKRDEAIPVSLVGADDALMMPVIVRGIAVDPKTTPVPVLAMAARQLWDYRTAVAASEQDLAGILNGLGGDGWEAVGISAQAGGRISVVLKRPR